jgi:hypothetical protein
MRIKNPITVYTLYACNEFRDTASYGRQFMITDLHNYYKRTLVQEALELIDDEDIQYLEGSHLHKALAHLKETIEFDIEDVGYINYVFNALCNQEIPYLDVKEHQILTDGSVEY